MAGHEAPSPDDGVDDALDDFIARKKAAMADTWYRAEPQIVGTRSAMRAAALILLLLSSARAFAGTPTEAVRPFYDHVGMEADPKERYRFVDPARQVLDAGDRLRASGEGDCFDPNLALDGVVAEEAEIDRTLKLVEAVRGDTAIVVVAFSVAGEPHRMQWKLKRVGGDWKIEDLLSVTNEWALSQYQCE